MNHDERCEKILDDSELLAKLTDQKPVTAESLKNAGWDITDTGFHCDFGKHIRMSIDFHKDVQFPVLLIFEYRNNMCVDDDFIDLPKPIKTIGQLNCLIRGLGGEVND